MQRQVILYNRSVMLQIRHGKYMRMFIINEMRGRCALNGSSSGVR
ncbi:unnamed protein product [Ixodes pacificus]